MFLAETELITGGVSMYPTLETIRQLAQTNEYRRIPLCRELYAGVPPVRAPFSHLSYPNCSGVIS